MCNGRKGSGGVQKGEIAGAGNGAAVGEEAGRDEKSGNRAGPSAGWRAHRRRVLAYQCLLFFYFLVVVATAGGEKTGGFLVQPRGPTAREAFDFPTGIRTRDVFLKVECVVRFAVSPLERGGLAPWRFYSSARVPKVDQKGVEKVPYLSALQLEVSAPFPLARPPALHRQTPLLSHLLNGRPGPGPGALPFLRLSRPLSTVTPPPYFAPPQSFAQP